MLYLFLALSETCSDPFYLAQEHADIVFRMSDDSGTTVTNAMKPIQQGPITLLTEALSTSPNLHTFSTLLPSLWNEAILRVSTNPSLQRIMLGDGIHVGSGRNGPSSLRPLAVQWTAKDFYAAPVSASLPSQSSPLFSEPTNQGIMGTGLFMLQAKKHARLTELIRSGTYVFFTSSSPFFCSSFSFAHPRFRFIDVFLERGHKPWILKDQVLSISLPPPRHVTGHKLLLQPIYPRLPTPLDGLHLHILFPAQ